MSSPSTSLAEAIALPVSSAKRRLNDLRTFQIPRLEGCRGPLSLLQELSGEMRIDLEGVRRNLEVAREIAESLPCSSRDTTFSQLDLLDQDYKVLYSQYRKALLKAKNNISTSASQRSKHEFSTSTTEPTEPEGERGNRSDNMADDALQTKTNEVTDALRRTTTLMQAELERSVLSVQMLDESTRTLRLTQSLYDNYTSLLSTSRDLVKAIEKADWWDRLTILSAFLLFLLCVGWVIKRRVMDKVVGGVWWWIGGSFKLVKMGVTGKSTKAVMPSAIPKQIQFSASTMSTGSVQSSSSSVVPGVAPSAVTIRDEL